MALACALPMLLGARGDGCASNSRSDAPDVSGSWNISYDDSLGVEITIGGSVYAAELGAAGGVVNITHDGHPLVFSLDCARADVLCPSEAWPATVRVEQRNTTFEHRMIMTLPTQECDGTLSEPVSAECGAGTTNEECAMVCDGDMVVRERERFGVIGETGDSFRLYLGAAAATNGINCALLGVSLADATLDNQGSSDGGDWRTVSMSQGVVTLAYAGGCLWAGDPNMDGQLEALVLGASVKFTTGFTGSRQ